MDVVVVGAGAAGLAATAGLAAGGADVVCLEARDRIGGRLLTVDAGPGRVDLGASWFWSGEERVERLVAAASIPVHPQHLDGDALYDSAAGLRRLAGNPIDVPARRYTDGARSVVDALSGGLEPGTVRLGCPVSSISADSGGVRVAGPGTEVTARHVVVALPPALAVEAIGFAPTLPPELERLARMTPVWMGHTVKVVAVYREPFWRSSGLAGAAISEIGPLREIHDLSGPEGDDPAALFGFAPANPGGPPLAPGQVVDQLVRMFGPAAAAPQEVLVTDWSRERWTSPPGAGQSAAYQLFGHRAYQQPALLGRLHWASTETATASPGHVEGALEAAARAASTVLAALRSPAGTAPPAPIRKAR